MSEMIEIVARAMWEKSYHFPILQWSEAGEEFAMHYREQARAAIEAMREPTEAMVAAASRPLRGQEGFHNELPFEQQWRHAIDAALR